jgi:hypothetical protein
MHLFCRLYGHLLPVLDDDAVYCRGDPMPLATTRAVGLALNSLVFNSHMECHRIAGAGKGGGRRPVLTPRQRELLVVAQAALQKLYARHVRRALCANTAWTLPWSALCAESEVCTDTGPQRAHWVWARRGGRLTWMRASEMGSEHEIGVVSAPTALTHCWPCQSQRCGGHSCIVRKLTPTTTGLPQLFVGDKNQQVTDCDCNMCRPGAGHRDACHHC